MPKFTDPGFPNPQDYPDASTPPDKPTGDAGFGMTPIGAVFGVSKPDTSVNGESHVGFGGVAGGPLVQGFADALPSVVHVQDIYEANEAFWQQWKGTDQ
jgi:hypothetical protein